MPLPRSLPSALALAGASALALSAAADTAVLTPVADGTLFEPLSPGIQASSGSGQFLYSGKTNSGKLRRALVRFDFSSIPAGSTITSVTLRVTVDRAVGGPRTIGMYACTAPWGEGASDAGDPGGRGTTPTFGDVTWIHSTFPGTPWAAAGGDFLPALRASATANLSGAVTWASTPELVADVQAWLDGSSANNGWLIHHVDESPNVTGKRFGSRENVAVESRPTLTVEFTPGGGAECIADFNDDDIVNSTDVSDFINQWFQDQIDGTLITDWDDNGVINSTDVSNFINDWFAAPPECTG